MQTVFLDVGVCFNSYILFQITRFLECIEMCLSKSSFCRKICILRTYKIKFLKSHEDEQKPTVLREKIHRFVCIEDLELSWRVKLFSIKPPGIDSNLLKFVFAQLSLRDRGPSWQIVVSPNSGQQNGKVRIPKQDHRVGAGHTVGALQCEMQSPGIFLKACPRSRNR